MILHLLLDWVFRNCAHGCDGTTTLKIHITETTSNHLFLFHNRKTMNIDLHSALSNVGNYPSSIDDGDRLSLVVPTTTLSQGRDTTKEVFSTKSSSKKVACQEKPARRLKKWKKPKDKPSRPLSAYNLFFRAERSIMLGVDAPDEELESLKKRVHCKTHGKIGFAEMARVIGARWKALDPNKRKVFELQAQKEKKRYKVELAFWKESRCGESSRNVDEPGLDAMASAALRSDKVKSCEIHRETLEEQSINHRLVDAATRSDVPSPNTTTMADFIRSERRRIQSLSQAQMSLDLAGALQERRAALTLPDTSLLHYPYAASLPSSALRRQFQYSTDAELLSSSIRGSQLLEINRLSRIIDSYYSPSQGLPLRQLPYLSSIPYGFNILHER